LPESLSVLTIEDMSIPKRRTAPGCFPTWVLTLDSAVQEGGLIRAGCSTCGQWKDVDLEALRKVKGGSYSLVNRRTRCRMTPDCTGWARFHYEHGVMRPLWDDGAAERWMGI
jgi:hypothetical protein